MGSVNEENRNHRGDREPSWVGAPMRELVRLAWPIAVSTVSYAVMTLVDTLFVGNLGASALAGVGLGGTVSFALLCFGFGLLRAVKVLVSQGVGAGRGEELTAYLGAGLLLAFGLGAAGLVAGQLLSGVIDAIAASPEAGGNGAIYLAIRSIGTPLFLANVALREHRYGLGDSRSPMWAAIAANVSNIGLDWLLIYPLGMGVAGAAWASVAAHVVEVAVLFAVQRRHGFGLGRTSLRHLRALFGVGLPTGAQFVLEVGSFLVLATLLAALSSVEMAAHQIALAVMHLTFLPALAIGEAGSILTGQAVGANRDDLVPVVARRAMMAAGAYAMLCTAGLVLGGRHIAAGFADDAAVIAAVVPLFWVAAVFQIADAANVVARCALRGTGDVTWPAVVGITCAWVFLPGLTWWLGYEVGLGALGGWLALCAEIITGAGLFWWRLGRGDWVAAAERSRARLAEPEPRRSGPVLAT